VGRELHLGIAVRTVKHTDGVSYVKFGPDVSPVIVTARLVAPGSHRGDPAVQMAEEAKAQGLCNGVIVDRGYTQSAPDRFHLPLQALGIAMFTRLKENQRGEKPGIGPARLIDGHLFCDSLPDDLVEPSMPPLGSTWEEKLPYMARFDQRAAYRYGRLKAPGTDGVTRWKHPVKNGTLRSRRVPASMRKSRTAPLVDLAEDADLSTVTAGAGELPLYQRCLCRGRRRGPSQRASASSSRSPTRSSTVPPERSPTSGGATPACSTALASSCSSSSPSSATTASACTCGYKTTACCRRHTPTPLRS
jgi:hypothetical protein